GSDRHRAEEGPLLRAIPNAAHREGARRRREGAVLHRLRLHLFGRTTGRRVMDRLRQVLERIRSASNRLRGLIADAIQYVQIASPGERRLILFAGSGGLAFLLLVLWAGFGSSISRHEDALTEKRSSFEKVQRLAAGYGQQEQERQLLEARLRQSPPALMGFVDGLARQEGLEIGGMTDRGVQAGGQDGRPRESSVERSE